MLTEQQKQKFKKLYEQCRSVHIPVVREQTAELLCQMIQERQPKNVLEIGTAIGYSGTLMLLSCEKSKLTTVELSPEMCQKAQQTFADNKVTDRVHIINQNALDFFEQNNQKFDFIFLDGPKGQYIKYLSHIKNALNKGGVCFCDDVLYFGMVKDDSLVIHKKITIVRNLREFIAKVQADKELTSRLLEIEDGILIFEKL